MAQGHSYPLYLSSNRLLSSAESQSPWRSVQILLPTIRSIPRSPTIPAITQQASECHPFSSADIGTFLLDSIPRLIFPPIKSHVSRKEAVTKRQHKFDNEMFKPSSQRPFNPPVGVRLFLLPLPSWLTSSAPHSPEAGSERSHDHVHRYTGSENPPLADNDCQQL